MNPNIQALVAAAKARAAQRIQEQTQKAFATKEKIEPISVVPSELAFEWNEQQQQAINFGAQGIEFVLTGAAGSGKTTTTLLS